MKRLVLSNLHNEFELAVADAEAVARADVIGLAGDIHAKDRSVEWARAFVDDPAKPVISVSGNHEFDQGHFDHTLDKLRELAQGAADRFMYQSDAQEE
ncbi:metallophosphoesterase family protein [Burkholderia sp. Ac-20392]|uniref:metallophosphoesterase family protein n=1 Tax=Burkholderia sp. Ac-20392 TaxID=2703905 RepID=UPI0019806D36|nr:metallophosphoesterase family protein [Burkholderia sp. Ac-20392]MBN3794705.1 hypothetical protein [Burkholderia sp. Ac-20392]